MIFKLKSFAKTYLISLLCNSTMATPPKSEIARRLPCYSDWKHCIKTWALRSSDITYIRLSTPISISKKINCS